MKNSLSQTKNSNQLSLIKRILNKSLLYRVLPRYLRITLLIILIIYSLSLGLILTFPFAIGNRTFEESKDECRKFKLELELSGQNYYENPAVKNGICGRYGDI